MQLPDSVKSALKRARASQPFNSVASTAFRGVSNVFGIHSEFIVKHLPRLGIVRSQLPNGRVLKMISEGDEWVPNQVFWRGWDGYEKGSPTVFYNLAERASVVFDVGAHVGFYSLLAALANPQSRVFAFEPVEATHKRLCTNVSLNGLEGIVQPHKAALGEVDGPVRFYRPEGSIPCSAGMCADFYKPWEESFFPIEVRSIRGDTFVEENEIKHLDLMKLDTESTEAQVLRGMANTIERDRPAILCEVLSGHGLEPELESFLLPLGYRFYLLKTDGPELRAHIEGDPHNLNYLFVAGDE